MVDFALACCRTRQPIIPTNDLHEITTYCTRKIITCPPVAAYPHGTPDSMIPRWHHPTDLRRNLAHALFFVAVAILAIDPVVWLVGTWRDPAYNSAGLMVICLFVGLALWSLTSPVVRQRHHRRRWLPVGLLAASAVVRLAGQILAINTLGAICLVIDVIALAMLFRLDARARPVSPVWLGIVFAFTLPIERILQRAIGYGLQHLSAEGACRVLSAAFDHVVCNGARITMAGTDVLVDLPCSGARGLVLCLLAFAVMCALGRPRLGAIVIGGMLTIAAAVVANIVRIVVLAIGIAWPSHLGGIDVMAAPWHEFIGLCALGLAAAPILVWSRYAAEPPRALCPIFKIPPAPLPTGVTSDGWWLSPQAASHPARLIAASAACVAALVVVNLAQRPLDVAGVPAPIALPLTLAGHVANAVALTDRERAYFTRFGGAAAKAQYGPAAVMLIRTTSPLRHLHAPEDCLRGLGFEVRYLGASFAPLPTAVYAATAPDGQRYRIEVSFVSDRGETTTNVATAVWRWLQGRARTWTAIQRITRQNLPDAARRRLTEAVMAAFELPRARTASITPSIAPNKGD
jgi:exosortase/archaeosortase family protein